MTGDQTILCSTPMWKFLRQEFDDGYESRVWALRDKNSVTTEKALTVTTPEQWPSVSRVAQRHAAFQQ